MTIVRGCDFPEDLYYLVERHVWVRPPEGEGGLVRLGITTAGFKLAGGKIAAVTPRAKSLGQPVARGKPVAMLESSKYVGAIQAPLSGVLVRVNDAVVASPSLAAEDPYGDGWIAELRPAAWEEDRTGLLSGDAAVAAYRQLLEDENISCG